jgi:hypothetical protein
MFETECRGCANGRKVGYFLYCSIDGKPAKTRCVRFELEKTKVYKKTGQLDLYTDFPAATTEPPERETGP